MRIMFLYMFPLWGNGSGAFLRGLTKELVERGHDVAIIAPDKRRLLHIKHYVVKPPLMGVFVGHPELPRAKRFEDMNGEELGYIFTSYLNTTIDAVYDFNPEIIHVFHTAFLPGIARIIKILFGIKFIITTHGSDLNYLARDRRFFGLVDDANRVARFITANSEFTRKWYLEMFGHNLRRKSNVIVGGVDMSSYRYDQKKIDEINKKYKLSNKKIVLFTGRLTANKGVMYLVKATESIRGTVVIIGNGPEKKNLENEIKKRKIKNVLMLGYMHASDSRLFHAFYYRADVYVSPSVWNEPLGLTILEAMAARTPVIATKKGGVVSVIKEGVNGFFVRARNSKHIAGLVNTLLSDDELREKLGNNAYKMVKEGFTWSKIADEFESIYKQFTYSTSEYLARVKGASPSISSFWSVNRLFR